MCDQFSSVKRELFLVAPIVRAQFAVMGIDVCLIVGKPRAWADYHISSHSIAGARLGNMDFPTPHRLADLLANELAVYVDSTPAQVQ